MPGNVPAGKFTMSIFGSILARILGGPGAAPDPDIGILSAPPGPAKTGQASGSTDPAAAAPAAPLLSAPPGPEKAGHVPASGDASVDVAAVLAERAAKYPEKLNWRESIVDLMKLLELDSGLEARRGLAAELHYPGSHTDTAAMNLWLHREVMRRVAANGGQVPASLLG